MRIILAPMQGVLDPFMRQLLTAFNSYDLCVSEFVRVVNQCLPKKVYYRLCPELYQQGYTDSGTPVRVQLLGQSPEWLAENAQLAIELGSHGIDFNCGCPSKTVNGSCGGASLLKQPELIYRATKAIRDAIGADETLSVKIRLGWSEKTFAIDIADAVQQGGADEIAVHGRTKIDGYRADRIDWEKIGEIRQALSIPVIANGEIFSWQDAQTCLAVTGCDDLMVARGALQIPNLSEVIKHQVEPLAWSKIVMLLAAYSHVDNQWDSGFYHLARIKQWLRFLLKYYTEAEILFEKIKGCTTTEALQMMLDREKNEI
ncbi:tRNA dihydrouridine(16) synthase DusC [Gallibacterium trehalosifermentans]|uniref:tRNA-dihydrouridine(16) synthase n=1 Tax=Gallibacterium trehalosifermentans TaxID=516935 RepID=A0ABV6H1T3_9PAST